MKRVEEVTERKRKALREEKRRGTDKEESEEEIHC